MLRQPNLLPYPIKFGSNQDLYWSVQQQSRGGNHQISVRFHGVGQHILNVQCDRRQVPYFKRFVNDWQNRKERSGSIFLLRSATLLWQPSQSWRQKQQKKPWNTHVLYLHCQIDTDLLTAEGLAKIRIQKQQKAQSRIENYITQGTLNPGQQADLKRKKSNLARLQATELKLPNKSTYKGLAHILLGVSLSRHQAVTVSIVDAVHNKVLLSQTAKQLLGESKSSTEDRQKNLLERRRKLQRQFAYERHNSQIKGKIHQIGESGLGRYLDQALGKRIIDLAQQHQASVIVLPDLKHLRERLNSELQVRAEEKCPGCVQAQKRYRRAYAITIHRWSYNRLSQAIQGCAKKAGVYVEFSNQPSHGTPQEQAKDIAIASYFTCQASRP